MLCISRCFSLFACRPQSKQIFLMCLFSMSFGLVWLNGCSLEKDNPDFRPCSLEENGCSSREICNGIDDDLDGQVDEASSTLCVSQNTTLINGQGPEGIGGFGRSLLSMGDLNEDGYEELLVGSSRTRQEITLRGQPRPGRIVLIDVLFCSHH